MDAILVAGLKPSQPVRASGVRRGGQPYHELHVQESAPRATASGFVRRAPASAIETEGP